MMLMSFCCQRIVRSAAGSVGRGLQRCGMPSGVRLGRGLSSLKLQQKLLSTEVEKQDVTGTTPDVLRKGMFYELRKVFTPEDVASFAHVSGDDNPLHLDAQFAATTMFKRPIVHGVLMNGLCSAIMGSKFPGQGTIYMGQEIRFQAPLFVGEEAVARVEILDIRDDKPILTVSTECYNAKGEILMTGQAKVMVPKHKLLRQGDT